jgi:hypothetical protein
MNCCFPEGNISWPGDVGYRGSKEGHVVRAMNPRDSLLILPAAQNEVLPNSASQNSVWQCPASRDLLQYAH